MLVGLVAVASRESLDQSGGNLGLIKLVLLLGCPQQTGSFFRRQVMALQGSHRAVSRLLSRGTASKPSRLIALKTDKSARDVVLSEPLAVVLRGHRERQLSRGQPSPDAFVFSTRTGTPLSHRNAARALTDACTTAGVRRVGFHVLRHGFASALIVGLGLDPVQVSRQLGHAAPSITLDT